MRKHHDIVPQRRGLKLGATVLITLIIHTASLASVDPDPTLPADLPVLVLNDRASWNGEQAVGLRCCEIDLAVAGDWWLTLRSLHPVSTPNLVVLGEPGDELPKRLEHLEGRKLRVDHPGSHLICLLGDLLGRIVIRAIPPDDGDPEEVEIIIDP